MDALWLAQLECDQKLDEKEAQFPQKLSKKNWRQFLLKSDVFKIVLRVTNIWATFVGKFDP